MLNATDLAEKLRRRRAELETAQDWQRYTMARLEQSPAITLSYAVISLNKAARGAIGWRPGVRVQVDFSPSLKVLRISPTPDASGYSVKSSGAIPARGIYHCFGLNGDSLREYTANGRRPPARPVVVVGSSLVVDVADLVTG